MTKKYSTKKALVASLLSLVLCFSMLIGTTFAWFTDSVTSANNIIKSGNLDIELYYQLEGETTWTKVTETTNVFKEDTLWEPGHTEVVKLKVVNEGSLALKYNLGVNVASEVGSVNMAGENFLLSEFIKFAVIDGANTYTRDEAIAAAEAEGATALKTAYNSGTTQLLATEEDYVTMVVYMPTTVGNEANPAKGAATPTINLGLNLFATQTAYEEDSFDNQYDTDAITIVTNAAEAQAALDNATAGTIIKLAPGVNYGTLKFRANPGHSNTTLEDIADAWAYNYNRSIEDITILGATGAKVDGIIFETGAQPGDCNNRVTVKNLVIDGIEFTDALTASAAGYNAPVMITTSNATVDGLTVKNCKLIGNNAKLNLVYLYGADGAKNVTLTGNTVDGIARLCELRGTENVTITGNTIKNTAEHAMLLSGSGYSGNVTITNNTAYGINNRFVRMAGAGDAAVVIKDNTITNYLGKDADYIKVTDSTGTPVIENNTLASIGVKDAASAQTALDNAVAGTTIQLQPGVNYGTLNFSANPGHSNTTQVDIANAYKYDYVRSIEDVTVLGATGAKVDGIIFKTGAQPGDWYVTATVKNLVIDGVEFTDALPASAAGYNAPVMITTSNATVDGLTVKNCTLIGDNDKLNLVYLYGADGAKNVTLTGNTVDGIARLCELRGTENVTITNNVIKNTNEHGMLLAGAGYSGNVAITGNVAYGINNRFVRMAGAGDAVVVIKNNTITNYLGSDADYIKVTDGTNVTIENNTKN